MIFFVFLHSCYLPFPLHVPLDNSQHTVLRIYATLLLLYESQVENRNLPQGHKHENSEVGIYPGTGNIKLCVQLGPIAGLASVSLMAFFHI